MKNMLRAVALAVPFLFAAGLASADEPMQLTDNQLDGVTAGADAFADAFALAVGRNNAYAETYTYTGAAQVGHPIVVQLTRVVTTGVVSESLAAAAAN